MRQASKKLGRVLTAAAAVVLLSGGAALAQGGATQEAGATTKGPELIERVLEGLGSDQYGARESASALLEMTDRVPLEAIEKALSRRDLSAEQRERLERAGLLRFAKAPRGGLGVQFGGWADGQVEISGTVEGFDAERLLEVGDVIVSMAGVRLINFRHAREVIVSHGPGESVVLEVLRRGRALTVTLRLGEFAALRNPQPLETDLVAAAWKLRRQRLYGEGAAPVMETGVTAGAWARLAREIEERVQARTMQFAEAMERARQGQQAEAGAALGGRGPIPRGVVIVTGVEDDEPAGIVAGGSARRPGYEAAQVFAAAGEDPFDQQGRAIESEIAALQQQLRVYRQRMRDPQLQPQVRTQMSRQVEWMESRVQNLRLLQQTRRTQQKLFQP